MPQEFLVVRCYFCHTFQVHQTRKDNKFTCKICGLKQSRKKVYTQGNAKDCRLAVQNLNAQLHSEDDQTLHSVFNHEENLEETNRFDIPKTFGKSKWDDYLEDEDCDQNFQFSEIESTVASTSEVTGISSNSFTKIKRFHDGEIKNRIIKEPSWEEKQKLPEENNNLRENAFKKFKDVDDNILDILNTSFYS